MSRAGGLALACAAVLVAGCGSTSRPPAKTLSHGRFVYLADRVCARAHRQGAALGKPTNLNTFIRGLRKAIPLLESEIADLRALTPPSRDAAPFQSMLANLDKEDVVGHDFLDSLEAHQMQRARSLARRIDRLDKRLRAQTRKLGLPTCAKA